MAATENLSESRIKVLLKAEEYEKNGLFDLDLEDDPPSRPLKKGEADYLCEKFSSSVKTFAANTVARIFFDRQIKKGNLIIKNVRGTENYLAIEKKGAIITSNHFNAFDNYAVFKAIQPYLKNKRLYRIIREGNYTGFKGLYGFFFRNCNTLPLASDTFVLKDMLVAVNKLLSRGEKILIYPEQGMWWNYKKPRPLKIGAFSFACRADVPVLPVFITMEDTEKSDPDGYPIQAYTVNILPAVFPDKTLSVRERQRKMCEENYFAWKTAYEEFYGKSLEYTTEGKEVGPCSI